MQRVEIVDAEVSTIAAAADKALKVTTSGGEFLVHLEFQSGHDAALVDRLFWYNVVLYQRHRLSVQTVLVLLTTAADSPRINDALNVQLPSGEVCLVFRYRTVRLWQVPAETILGGGLGVMPLAPLGVDKIVEIVAKMQRRFDAEATESEQDTLWAATFLLVGLQIAPDAARRLIVVGRHMRESSTYQAVLEEGRIEGRTEGREQGRNEGREQGRHEGRTQGALHEARKLLLQLGSDLLGKPAPAIKKSIQSMTDLEHLEQLALRVPKSASWQELLKCLPNGSNGHKKDA